MTLADHLAAGPVEAWRLALIADYAACVRRHVPAMQARYPGHDVEPMMFNALYLAALTWEPGRAGFFAWYRSKVAGATFGFRRTMANRRRGHADGGPGPTRRGAPFKVTSFEAGQFDRRCFYRDPPRD